VRIRVNFALRNRALRVCCVSPGDGASISSVVTVPDDAMLARLLRYVGATETQVEEAQKANRRWGFGGLSLELLPGRRNLLHVHPPWSTGLKPD